DDTNGVFVSRSTNGGYTWTRARVGGTTPNPVLPGDGVVIFQADNNTAPDFSVTFHDKEYIAAGPRPAGVTPQCFTPAHTPAACDPASVGVDRLYVSWTAFNNPTGAPGFIVSSTIEVSFSDDQGRSWSARRTVNGSAPFCMFAFAGGTRCDDNQFSTPTVSPDTGFLYVAFENFNTPDENQYLVVRSHDGGQTFQGPFFVTPVFDVNFPRSGAAFGRPDCATRTQQNGRIVYTNSCFRSNPAGNIVADKRGGAFADDLYLVMSDNRNGTIRSSNADSSGSGARSAR
ncbi:MAG: sialidase family protein, partial [bacterium]